jgi:hypothetical protein
MIFLIYCTILANIIVYYNALFAMLVKAEVNIILQLVALATKVSTS